MPNDKPETIAAVVAEMRESARDSFASKLVAEYEETGRLDDGPAAQALKDDDVYLVQLAGRIEAAAKRERDEDRQLAAIAESDEAFARCARCDRPERAPGNAAAMRSALERIVNLAPEYPAYGVDWNALAADAFLTASAALAAPPEPPSNAAAMRAALNRVEHLANDLSNITGRDTEVRADVNEIVDVCRAAIAAPARNCDRFATEDEAREAYWAYRDPLEFNGKPFVAITEWLFAPADGRRVLRDATAAIGGEKQ